MEVYRNMPMGRLEIIINQKTPGNLIDKTIIHST